MLRRNLSISEGNILSRTLISQDGATNHLSRSSAGYAAIEESGAEPHTKGIGRND